MAMEKGHTYSLRRARMISINNNSELVFTGGWSDEFLTEVWKYKYFSKSWELLGNIQIGRENHLFFPVTGMECP